MMTRETMIQMLVIERLRHAADPRGFHWLEKSLELGFVGYANMSDDELTAEIQAHQLDTSVDSSIHEDEEHWDEEEAELALQLRSTADIYGAQ